MPSLAGKTAKERHSVTLQGNWLAGEDEVDMQPQLRARVGRAVAAAAATFPEMQLDVMKL